MLTRSFDRKVANAVCGVASMRAAIANTYGLPAGKAHSCPGETDSCVKCYAKTIERIYASARAICQNNFDQLREARYSVKVDLLREMIDDFIRDCKRLDAEQRFRIHYDGDVFNEEYAYSIAETACQTPSVSYWLYTRSEFAIEPLIRLPNLDLVYSVDEHNIDIARRLQSQYPSLRFAFLGQNFTLAAKLSESMGLRSTRCPENRRVLPLISSQGSACMRCRVCFSKHVSFSVTKK